MKSIRTVIGLLLLAAAARAQVAAPNAAGVAMGHLHFNAADPEPHRQFWTALGATPVKLGSLDGMKLAGVLIFVRKAEPGGGTEGSVIGHVGLQVKSLGESLPRWKAAGVKVESEGPRQAFLAAPDGVRVEVTEAPALKVPIACHHVHFYVAAVDEARDWYARMFHATPGRRGRFQAADIPGANLTFAPAERPTAPTRGRALDHIGFEVRDLESFCKKLEAAGVRFEVPYRKVPALGIALAFLTDPWGTYLELTEGLDRL